jgi:glycerol-3-phosphate O-acyltransferase
MRLGRLFAQAEIPAGVEDDLRDLARQGSIVFVMRSAGWLNLSFVRWLARRLGFAPVAAAVGMGGLRGLALARRGTLGALRDAVAARAPALVFLRRPRFFRAKGVSAPAGKDDPFPVLVEIQRALPHPIFLVPILYVWSRRPHRIKPSLLDIVFGSPEAPGLIATTLAFLRNYGRAFVRMGRAVDLRDLLAVEARRHGDGDAAAASAAALVPRKARGVLYYHLSREARAVLGPPFKEPARVREEVLRDRALQDVVAAQAARAGRPVAEVARRAEKIVKEIAAHMSPLFFEIIRPVVVWICERLYQGIEVDEAGLAEVRQAANAGGLVLCPGHKSHMDYVMLTYLFYERGLLPPHVAAGINLAFWPFGAIARWSGGFFIRRSFKGDHLYAAVLRAYVKRLMRDGFPQEFFIEGGRSRTGKLAFPKTGLLSMEVDAWPESTQDDLFFVPIAIDYEKLPEGKSYATELSGAEKRKESFGGLLRARKVLRSRHGRIYIQFGAPVSLKAFSGARGQGPGLPEDEGARRAFVQSLANRIAYGINRASTITPVGLCAAALLASRGETSAATLERRVSLLREIAARDGVRSSASLAGASSAPAGGGPIAEALALLARDGLVTVRRDQGDSDGQVYGVPAARRAELDFYRNNVIHHFVAYAIVAAASARAGRAPCDAAGRAATERAARWLSRLFKLEFMYRVGAPFETIFAETLAAMAPLRLIDATPDAATGGGAGFLAQMVRPYLDAYRAAAETLAAWPGGDRRSFVRSALERARQEAAADRALPEAVSKATLENATAWLAGEGAFEPADGDAGGERLRVAAAWRDGPARALVSDIDAFRAPLGAHHGDRDGDG